MVVHGIPRATGDIDIWIECTPGNAAREWQALAEFGAPVESLGVSKTDLATPNTVVQIGLPPRRVDLLTSLTGIEFTAAWAIRTEQRVGDLAVPSFSPPILGGSTCFADGNPLPNAIRKHPSRLYSTDPTVS